MYYFVLSAAFCILTVTIKCEYGIPNTDRLMFPLLAFPISSFFSFCSLSTFLKAPFIFLIKLEQNTSIYWKRGYVFFFLLGDSTFFTPTLKTLVNVPHQRPPISWGFLISSLNDFSLALLENTLLGAPTTDDFGCAGILR